MHIMIDLETMGSSPGSAILSIGAVKFSPNTRGVYDKFYVRVNLESCQRQGLRIDASTVLWWMSLERSVERQKLLEEGTGLDLPEALDGFSMWAKLPVDSSTFVDDTPLTIWSNGATFDIMLMRAAFQACRLEVPWGFRDERCFRTLKNLVKLPVKPAAHHALQDAIDQAYDVQTIVSVLGITL